jgi:hypothetical protein
VLWILSSLALCKVARVALGPSHDSYSVLRMSCAVHSLHTLYLVLEPKFLLSGLCDMRAFPPLIAEIILTCPASVWMIRPACVGGPMRFLCCVSCIRPVIERFGFCQERVALVWRVRALLALACCSDIWVWHAFEAKVQNHDKVTCLQSTIQLTALPEG